VRVVIAPDGFGGTLSARDAAAAIAAGWHDERPQDEILTVAMSDGGEGLLDVVATSRDTWLVVEVAGPHGHPIEASLLLREDGTAIVESAAACGLALVPPDRRDPRLATTYGVGQLLDAAREAGARRILVGLGGSATVDGGAGALSGLGFRLRVADGSGLKIGADDLHRIATIERGWAADWHGLEVDLLADVTSVLAEAAPRFGPQKGASADQIAGLATSLDAWAEVVERDLAAPPELRDAPGSGAAGGLGFGLAAALGARFVPGSATVGELVGLTDLLDGADTVITGEGRLDATTAVGKVVGHVAELARSRGARVLAVVGQVGDGGVLVDDVEASAPDGHVVDAAAEVRAAARRLAGRVATSG
jgi:glycerate 2-kinase